jgi:PAS domain S-box-containing protein
MAQPPDAPQLPELRTLVAATAEPCLLLAPDLSVLAASASYLRLLGLGPSAVLGRRLAELLPAPPLDLTPEELEESLRRALAAAAPDALPVRPCPAPGPGRPRLRRLRPVQTPALGPDGAPIAVWHRLEDLTELFGPSACETGTQERHNRALVELAKSLSDARDLQASLQELTEAAARTLEVERVGIWLYDEARAGIRCTALFQQASGHSSEALQLAAAEAPAYFRALETERIIAAHDALTDPRTCDFAAAYLRPLDIGAMLDAPVRLHGQMIGVLCHEHVGRARLWSLEEQGFAASVADLVALAFEIAERRRAYDALRESEERFRTMADSVPVLIWMSGPDNDGLFFNRTWLEFTGRTREQELGMGWLSDLHPDDASAARKVCGGALSARRPFETQFRMRRADGAWRWMLDTGVPRFSPEGTFQGFVGTCVDITERKDREDALQQSETHFRQIAEIIPQIVWTARPDGHIDYYNRRWHELTGHPETLGGDSSWMPLLHPDDLERCVRTWRGCVQSGEPYEIEYRIRDRAGEYRWNIARAMPLRGPEGRIVKWFGTSTDIDEQKRAQHELREADRRKNEFLAMLGHELRNPLGAIGNAVHLLANDTDERHRGWALEIIQRQMHHIARLVDDLLDVSRITRGKIELRREPLELGQIATRALQATSALVASRGHRLSVSLHPADLRVQGDAARLEQVIVNLLSNAAKYTDPGGRIWLETARRGAWAELRVRDTGIGIDAELLPQVFDLFTQDHRALDRAAGGLGIGLTLVRSIVEMHGGEVRATSAGRGQGSELLVRLPLLL